MSNTVKLTSRKEIMGYDFGCPKQVLFREEDKSAREWNAGIAWGEMVICGCCGGTIPLDEIEEMEVFESGWVGLEAEIGGDELLEKITGGGED